jgi:hypothetical protein
VLDAADGARNQGIRPERLENARLRTTAGVRGEANSRVVEMVLPKRKLGSKNEAQQGGISCPGGR